MILDGGNSTCENLEAPGDESCGGGHLFADMCLSQNMVGWEVRVIRSKEA